VIVLACQEDEPRASILASLTVSPYWGAILVQYANFRYEI